MPAPALILFNTVSGAERGHPFYQAWAEIAASKGLVAIMPDLRVASLEQDFDALLAHLAANAAALGVDRDRIAVYAGSGNVYRGLPLFLDPKRTALKTMVLYYGSADVKTFRGDLPTLFVRAGLDRPPVNRAMTDLITLAQTQNVPMSVINYPGGHHAFEMFDDEAATRDVIDTTLDFVARSTSPAYQASLRRGLPEATAAAHVAAGDFAAAATVYARSGEGAARGSAAAAVVWRGAPRRVAVRRGVLGVRSAEGQGAWGRATSDCRRRGRACRRATPTRRSAGCSRFRRASCRATCRRSRCSRRCAIAPTSRRCSRRAASRGTSSRPDEAGR